MKVIVKIESDLALKKIENKDSIFSIKKKVEYIELIHLPYYFFKSEIMFLKEKSIIQHICVDGIMGEFAFVEKNKLKFSENIFNENSELLVSEKDATFIAGNAVKSMLMIQKGKGIKLQSIELNLENMILYPYWVGYYQRKTGVDFEVVDAVNGKKQGAKMKPVFLKLIMQEQTNNINKKL